MAARSFKVDIDSTALDQQAAAYKNGPKIVQAATVSTMNWVGKRAMTQVKRGLAKTTGIPYNKIEGSSRGLRFAAASPGHLVAEIVARSDWTPLGYFSPSQLGAGVKARAWNVSTLYRGTFLMTFKSGYVAVMKREDPRGKRVTRTRINPKTGRPMKYTSQVGGLEELWGPSLQREMMREPIPVLFTDTIETLWPDRFMHEFGRVVTAQAKAAARS